jgi:hypothetical protein
MGVGRVLRQLVIRDEAPNQFQYDALIGPSEVEGQSLQRRAGCYCQQRLHILEQVRTGRARMRAALE